MFQVLIVGAGYDVLSLLLSKQFNKVNFVEVDHPTTLPGKKKAVETIGKPKNLNFVAVDLSSDRLDIKLVGFVCWSSGNGNIELMAGRVLFLGL
jgi:O-methyltransferase involved in polyketide biosynthesis